MKRLGDVETVEQHRGIGFRRVAALIADNALQFAEAHAVVIGQRGVIFFVQLLAFLQRVP